MCDFLISNSQMGEKIYHSTGIFRRKINPAEKINQEKSENKKPYQNLTFFEGYNGS